MTKIVITGWGKEAGPAYDVIERKTNQRTFRKEAVKETIREHRGRSYQGADYRVIERRGGTWLVLNEGHEYEVSISINGTEIVGNVDAKDSYKVVDLGEGQTLVRVTPVEPPAAPDPED